jgi:hypothetical protein
MYKSIGLQSTDNAKVKGQTDRDGLVHQKNDIGVADWLPNVSELKEWP